MILPLILKCVPSLSRTSIEYNNEYIQSVIDVIYEYQEFNAVTLMKFNALIYAVEKSVETMMHSMIYNNYSAIEYEFKTVEIMTRMDEVFKDGLNTDDELNKLNKFVINRLNGLKNGIS